MSDDDVDVTVRRGVQVDVPADVEERLRGRLVEFRAKVAERKPAREWMRMPALRLAAMAAAVIAVVAAGLLMVPRESPANRIFAAAAAELRNASSLQYTIVLNDEPYVGVDFAWMAPGYRRLNCSWGIEVRTDGTTKRQMVLFHGSRNYLDESGKTVESVGDTEDFAGQLRALPQQADEVLGEKWTGSKKLIGYRLNKPPANTFGQGLKSFDVWVDAATREADHVDIVVQEPGKPAHTMHIANIRAGAEVDRSLFDLTPPAGYTAFDTTAQVHSGPVSVPAIAVTVGRSAAMTAVVMPMRGSYAQAGAVLEGVASYLKEHGIMPAGPPLGHFASEEQWDAGYPVPPGTEVEAPLQVVNEPAALTASAAVAGQWGEGSEARWSAFLKATIEQGYVPTGPPVEVWTGEEGKPETQSTEMRMAVRKAK